MNSEKSCRKTMIVAAFLAGIILTHVFVMTALAEHELPTKYRLLIPDADRYSSLMQGLMIPFLVRGDSLVAQVTLNQLRLIEENKIPYMMLTFDQFLSITEDAPLAQEMKPTEAIEARTTKKVAFMVDQSLVEDIRANLTTFIKYLSVYQRVYGEIFSEYWNTPQALRDSIYDKHYQYGFNGFILVGRLPYAMWEFPWGEICPLPFYYEDLDGDFSDLDGDGLYDYHIWGANDGPECWVSFIQAAQNNPNSINQFLHKCTQYYENHLDTPQRALICINHDWWGAISPLRTSLSQKYSMIDSIGGEDWKVSGQEYLDPIQTGYELTTLWVHSSSDFHQFDRDPLRNFPSSLLSEVEKGSLFTMLFACHVLDFNQHPDTNFGIAYTTDTARGLATIGAVRSIGTGSQEVIYDMLAKDVNLADAYFTWLDYTYDFQKIKEWFPEDDINRFVWDFALFGNPFILNQNFLVDPAPDTGQNRCYNDVGDIISCPGPGNQFYGQDGNYTINPLSYVKLDANGNALPESATSWAMVRDNVTGLIWEVKGNKDGVKNYVDPHDADNTYTWYDPDSDSNGGNAGTPGDGADTRDFLDAINTARYGGYSDWRLPDIKELSSIVNYGIAQPGPSIYTKYFPNAIGSVYWSSTTYARWPNNAWYTGFHGGNSYATPKDSSFHVRAVRGKQPISISHQFQDNGDGTITDMESGLTWQKERLSSPKSWEEALSCCEELSLGQHSDWRLPNLKELRSVVDYDTYDPAINAVRFPPGESLSFWSSTTNATSPHEAWLLDFFDGHDGTFDKKSITGHVRAVRGRPSGALDVLYVHPSGSCGEYQPCYSAIQEAIDAAADGDTILVRHGDYHETIVLDQAKSLKLQCGRNDDFGPGTLFSTANALQIERGSVIVERLHLVGD